jgi:hypothetical protein
MDEPMVKPLPPAGAEVGKEAAAGKSKPMSAAGWVAMGLLVLLSFYFMFTYSGPYQWLAELQLKLMNSYSEKLTLLLTMLALLLPAAGILKLMQMGVKSLGPGGAGKSTVARAASGASGSKVADIRIPQWVILPFLGVIVFSIGAYMYWRGATAGPLTSVSLKDLEDGKRPASSYLSVEGVPLWKAMISFKETSTKCYVPLVSRDWKGEGVSVYVECSDDDVPRASAQLEEKTFKGVKAVGGLPGPVRVSYEKSAFKPAVGYLMIETKEEPAKLTGFGKWPMIVGVGLVAAGLLWWGVKRMVAGRG